MLLLLVRNVGVIQTHASETCELTIFHFETALVDMFVEKLARSSNGAAINYKLVDLEKFVDSFKDVAALVYVKSALRFCITFSSLP